MKRTWRSAAVSLVALICIWAGSGQAEAQTANAGVSPDLLREVGIDQRLNEQVPLDLWFKDESGRAVQLKRYFGKPVILTLVYYDCPMLCTMVLNGTLESLNTLSFDAGKQFNVVTVSFDPGEGPELAMSKKRAYVSKYGRKTAEEGWHFLTGDEAAIRRLTEAVGFKYKYDAEKDQFVHASGIMVLTPEGRVSHYFYGVEYPARDLKLALMEAADRKIGSPVDQVLLYCFHYDPTTGKYGLVIMNVIRLLGTATVVALVSFMLIMLRRDRRKKRRARLEEHNLSMN
ncbi:MAG: SCO family protein [Calditrichaeota bacterium]|nr:MAG: SCO family protein [Calditrichota bacterium]